MPLEYTIIPPTINSKYLNDIKSLSPSNYYKLNILNNNTISLNDLASHPVRGGKEVGSKEYIPHSTKFFIRTSGLNPDNFILDYESDGLTPIRPQAFKKQVLEMGDILISKDSNVGEVAILEKDLPDFMVCGGIRILKIPEKKYYVYAILKHTFFKKQLEFKISRGATLKHAKDKYLDCKIPFPNQINSDEVIEFVSLMVRAIMRKEIKIRENNKIINELIHKELVENQTDKKFHYVYPTFNEIKKYKRIDTGLYTEEYKRKIFLIENYRNGAENIYEWGFDLSRGQNLQISSIGKSIYSDEEKESYYKLFLPTNLTSFGTVSKIIYLGSKNKLKCLEKGDIIIGVEGFEKGRSIVITEDVSKTITNIHGLTLKSKEHNLTKSIYIRAFLNYLRNEKLIDSYAVGGNGGSLAIKYWEIIKFPKFPTRKQEDIKKYYYNKYISIYSNIDLSSFEQEDIQMTNDSGIIQLNSQIKALKYKLNSLVNEIIMNKTISIDFIFYENILK